jgi:hypothetical protein
MKTPLLSDREADSADYLTAAEILKGQLAGYPTDTYAHNRNEDLDRLQREHPDWSPARRERPGIRGHGAPTRRARRPGESLHAYPF